MIDELAAFYRVSKQSAKIRMIELGYSEADGVYNYDGVTRFFNPINHRDAFYAYCDNPEFRELIDSGLFRYIDGYYVIDDARYIAETTDGYTLTEYARDNLAECSLSFTYHRVDMRIHGRFHADVFHRDNADAYAELPEYNGDRNISVIDNARELQRRRAEFQVRFEVHRATAQTFPEIACSLMEWKHWNSTIFQDKTLLGGAEYSKLTNTKGTYEDKPWSFRTVMAICVGLGVDQLTGHRMLAAAGLTFGASREHQAYAYVLSAFSGASIDEVNTFLESENLKPLGNLPRKGS